MRGDGVGEEEKEEEEENDEAEEDGKKKNLSPSIFAKYIIERHLLREMNVAVVSFCFAMLSSGRQQVVAAVSHVTNTRLDD